VLRANGVVRVEIGLLVGGGGSERIPGEVVGGNVEGEVGKDDLKNGRHHDDCG
jgi:hypothetical protein